MTLRKRPRSGTGSPKVLFGEDKASSRPLISGAVRTAVYGPGGAAPAALTAEYLVIAGAGGGSTRHNGGGGAGGYRSSVTGEPSGGGASAEAVFNLALNTAYTVTVGAGGAAEPHTTSPAPYGNPGSDSTFDTIVSVGGGGGGAGLGSPVGENNGGSGGGGDAGGTNIGTGTAGQGFNGGAGSNAGGLTYHGGGGGGAAQVGGNSVTSVRAGNGGDGVESYITGAGIYRAGGGGGSSYAHPGGAGGLGGGGAGGGGVSGTAGTANTGGGGGAGGGNSGTGAAGGSGVVIIRVPSTVVAEFSAGVVYNYIPLDDFNVYEITAAGVSDTVTFSQGAVTTVNNSLRFNDNDSAYLSRTPSSAGNRKTWTWSGWVKRGNLSSLQTIFTARSGAYSDFGLQWGEYLTTKNNLTVYTAGSYLQTSAVYRDVSAWYHLTLAVDTTQATSTDRIKIYVNGTRITSFAQVFNPTLNQEFDVNDASLHTIGSKQGTSEYFDGYLSDVYFIDGEALDPSRFGKQDADGIWQPISYTGSYGTNGFHLDFADNSTAAALGTDTSGNGNNWTPSGITTDDQVTDTPSVNYCTLNPVDPRTTGTLSNGNLVTTGNASVTMRPTAGQYYYEKDGVGVSYDTAVSGPFDPVLPAGSYNFGQLPWADTGPTGAEVALNSSNLPAPTITDGKAHFQPALYTGNGTTQAIGGLEFQPDLVWIKNRSSANSHILSDAVRGAGAVLISESTAAEFSLPTDFQSFDASGFTVGYAGFNITNGSGQNYVAWNWNAGGSTVTNTDGTITSQVRANTTAGFSIMSYTGSGFAGGIGHGLNAAPDLVIVKNRQDSGTTGSTNSNWAVYHSALGYTKNLQLNSSGAPLADPNYWGNADPDASVVYVNNYNVNNASGKSYIMYAFHSVDGFSKFGSYTGNGSADGPFVYTGFRPAFVVVKGSSGGGSWDIHDAKRDPYNPSDTFIQANTAAAEYNVANIDILSNGFKLRTTDPDHNTSGATYIYMAFAENPFKTARAR